MAEADSTAALAGQLRAAFVAAPDKPDETADSTFNALAWLAAGERRPVARAGSPPSLDAAQRATLAKLVARRVAGEPLAYLLGVQEFLGIEFDVAPGALIPRRETEIVGRAALAALADVARRRSAPRVLDLCTGCGNVAIALALASPSAAVVATDLEAAALQVAERNCRRHRVQERVTLAQGDLFGALAAVPEAAPFDLITCNPPYLSSKHANNMPAEIGAAEPVAAFDGGPFGLSIVLRLIREAPKHLIPGGWLCFEIGAGQFPMVASRMKQIAGYGALEPHSDENGVVRAIKVAWRGTAHGLPVSESS